MKVKKLVEDAILPIRANPSDSGMDIFANNIKKIYRQPMMVCSVYNDYEEFYNTGSFPLTLQRNERALIGTGISVSVHCGYEVQVRPRSGNALKNGLTVLNTPGTIDSSYRGEVGVIVINVSNVPQTIIKDMKIAQLVVQKVELCNIEEVEDLDKTERGDGGFGSTDKYEMYRKMEADDYKGGK